MKSSGTISTKDLAEILVQAIRDEQFFSKEILIPKVRAIISAFRLSISTANYNKIKNPSQTARLIRSNELHNLEKEFWKQELKNIVGEQEMIKFYAKRDEQRFLWENTEYQSQENEQS